MRSQEKEGIGALKEGVYVKAFAEVWISTDSKACCSMLISCQPCKKKEGMSSAYLIGLLLWS
jgi:hypothetical protein